MPTTFEPTPQRLHPTKRRIVGRHRRVQAVRNQVATHKAILEAHTAASLPLPRSSDVLAAAETQLGKRYCLCSCRCDAPGDACDGRDCSGEICFAVNEANRLLGNPTRICTSSFGFAQMGRDAGLIIPKGAALWTPGAIGVRCPFCDPNFNGSNGHVWFCKGDGVHSIEEGGHSTGCYEGLADKDGDVIFMLIPGVDYHSSPLASTEEIPMFVQLYHYDSNGKRLAPCVPPKGFEGFDPVIRVGDDGKTLEAWWGASMFEDQPVDPHNIYVRRIWRPGNPLGTAHFTGVAFKDGTSLDARPYAVATVSDGTTRHARLS